MGSSSSKEKKNENKDKKMTKVNLRSELKDEVKNELKKEVKIEIKNEVKNEIKNELKIDTKVNENIIGDSKPVPIEIIIKVRKCICKIIFKNNGNIGYGSGFFMKIDNLKKFLITNYHNISPEIINNVIEIELYNNKKMKLNFENRFIKYFPPPKDITIIEIMPNDEIYNII